MDVKIEQYDFTNGSGDLVIIDIHGYTLYEVETDLPYLVIDHLECGYHNYQIIHGYHSGQTLKNYVRSTLITKLKQDAKSIKKIRKWNESEGDIFLIIEF